MTPRGLRTHALDAPDVEAARDWYARLFGVAPYFDQPFYVGFDIGGFELGVVPREGGHGSIPYWASANVAADTNRAIELGASLLEAPHDVGEDIVVGAVRDPFGNALGFIENRHFAPPLVAARGTALRAPIVLEVEVPASAATCFAAWTDAASMATWWVKEARIDLRIGGHFELYFMRDAPWGLRGSEGCRVLSYLPDRMLSFSWNAPPHLDRTRNLYTWVVLELDERESGTSLRLTHTGWPETGWEEEPQWGETRAYFEAAWATVLRLFREHFAAT